MFLCIVSQSRIKLIFLHSNIIELLYADWLSLCTSINELQLPGLCEKQCVQQGLGSDPSLILGTGGAASGSLTTRTLSC